MVYDPGALHVALSAAVGDDPSLIAELRGVFLDSASEHVATLARAQSEADWQVAAWRLQGLAASFGAVALMALAEQAATGALGDPVVLRRIRAAIAAFDG